MINMGRLFSTRILRENAKNSNLIVDAGCGAGTDAIYLAERCPSAYVRGYDRNGFAISKAELMKLKHGVPNVSFEMANHDTVDLPWGRVDMLYTCWSLLSADEIPSISLDPLGDSYVIKQRFSKFAAALTPGGLYVLTYMGCDESDDMMGQLAYESGLRHVERITGSNVNIGVIRVRDTALIYRRPE